MEQDKKGIVNPPEPILTIDEVAELLGVHANTVYRYIQRGWLKASKWGERTSRTPWRIRQSDVYAFMNSGIACAESTGQGNEARGHGSEASRL